MSLLSPTIEHELAVARAFGLHREMVAALRKQGLEVMFIDDEARRDQTGVIEIVHTASGKRRSMVPMRTPNPRRAFMDMLDGMHGVDAAWRAAWAQVPGDDRWWLTW